MGKYNGLKAAKLNNSHTGIQFGLNILVDTCLIPESG